MNCTWERITNATSKDVHAQMHVTSGLLLKIDVTKVYKDGSKTVRMENP